MKWEAINTVAEALNFLKTIELEVIGIGHGWILHGTGEFNGDFELTCDSNAELIEYARSGRDICLKICEMLGDDVGSKTLQRASHSSGAGNEDQKKNSSETSSAPQIDDTRGVRK